jgi:hypothetical protein
MLNRRSLAADRRSVAALEFVLVAPLLVALLFGVYDISSALIFYQEVYNAAHSIAASVSNMAVQSDGTTVLTYSQVQQVESELWGQMPSLRSDFQDGMKSITVSSIVFEPANASCNAAAVAAAAAAKPPGPNPCLNAPGYVPVVVWSVAYAGGDSGRTFQTSTSSTGTVNYTPVNGSTTTAVPIILTTTPLRSCSAIATTPRSTLIGSLNQTLPNAGSSSDLTNLRMLNLTDPDPTTAPPSPIVVVDVHLQYKPILGLVISTPLNFWVSGYWPVRSVKTSISQTFPLYQQFTTINPDVPATVTNPTENNGNAPLYDNNGNLAATANYCVNNTLPNATFPFPAESQ